MKTTVLSLPTLDKLHAHVHQMLCSCDNLDPTQTPLQAAILKRAGKPCGMTFAINGPRQVYFHAVWAAQENRVLFYDSTGARFAETQLMDSPELDKVAA